MNTDAFPVIANGEEKLKSFWNRPGGKIGVVIAAGLAIVAGYFLLPILTAVVWNTLNFGIALACLGVFLYVATNRKTRLALYYLYNIAIKYTVGLIIELDPFVIGEDYISDMEKQREKLSGQILLVNGQKEDLQMTIDEKQKQKLHQMDKAKAAKKNDMAQELGNASRQISRLDEFVKQLLPIRDNLNRIGEYLEKVYKNSAFVIEDAKNELSIKKELYKSVTRGNRALQTALKIFTGDPEKKMMVEQSMDYLKDDIGKKLAGMKQAITNSTDFMKSIDLDNATFEESGLRFLETYDPDAELTLTKPKEKVLVNRAPGTIDKTQYDDLIK
jgi:hypothetical protein